MRLFVTMVCMAGSIKSNLEVGDLSRITTYQAGAMQALAHRALRLRCDRVLGPYGITKRQWLVIGLTLDAGPSGISLRELSTQLDMTAAALSAVVAVLVKQCKVIRQQIGRQRGIALHPKFIPDCVEIERILRTALRESIYASVSPLEFRMYLKVLHHLSQLPDA